MNKDILDTIKEILFDTIIADVKTGKRKNAIRFDFVDNTVCFAYEPIKPARSGKIEQKDLSLTEFKALPETVSMEFNGYGQDVMLFFYDNERQTDLIELSKNSPAFMQIDIIDFINLMKEYKEAPYMLKNMLCYPIAFKDHVLSLKSAQIEEIFSIVTYVDDSEIRKNALESFLGYFLWSESSQDKIFKHLKKYYNSEDLQGFRFLTPVKNLLDYEENSSIFVENTPEINHYQLNLNLSKVALHLKTDIKVAGSFMEDFFNHLPDIKKYVFSDRSSEGAIIRTVYFSSHTDSWLNDKNIPPLLQSYLAKNRNSAEFIKSKIEKTKFIENYIRADILDKKLPEKPVSQYRKVKI